MGNQPAAPSSRRQAERYRISVEVELPGATGHARDASLTGVYFVADRDYEVGDSVEFTLLFPSVQPPPVRLRCHGTVVRVEPADDGIGVAVRVDAYTIPAPFE